MPKRRKEVLITEEIEPETPANQDDETRPRKKRGVFVPFNEFGQLDPARVRDPGAIEQARIALSASAGTSDTSEASVGEVQFITEEHVKHFLDMYCVGCSYGIPAVINPKLRAGGVPEIPHELAARIYHLTDEQKNSLAPDGAQFFNEQFQRLPQWLKDFILSVGPGAKFFGQLAFITTMQTKAMMDEWKATHLHVEIPEQKPPAPVN